MILQKDYKIELLIEKFIILILLLFIGLASHLLIKPRATPVTPVTPVGHSIKLIEKINDVRRKQSSELNWTQTVTGDFFDQNDMVFTGDNSFGKLKLSDGSIIVLSPNSIIAVQETQTESILKIKQGSFSGSLRGKTKIKLNNGNLIRNTSQTKAVDFQLKIEGKSSIQLSIKSGQAAFEGPSESKNIIRAGQSISQVGEKIIVQPNTLIISSPGTNILYSSSNTKKIKFKWSYSGKSDYFKILISKGQSFKNLKTFNSKELSTTINLNFNKIHYWKIQAIKNEKIAHETEGYFLSKQMMSPKTYLPEDRSSIVWPLSSESNPMVSFQWEAENLNVEYKLVLAKDALFKKIYHESINTEGRTDLNIEGGRYFWKVQTISKEYSSKWSSPKSFSITKINLKNKFKIINPRPGSTFYTKKDLKTYNFRPEVYFPNTYGINALYDYQVSEDANFDSILTNKESNSPKTSLSLDTNRHYFLRVTISSDHFKHQSKVVPFEVKETKTFRAPEIKIKQIELELIWNNIKKYLNWVTSVFISNTHAKDLKKTRLKLDWEPIEGAKTYRIQISKSPSFKKVFQQHDITKSKISLSGLKTGVFYWRVRVNSSEGMASSDYTIPSKIIISIPHPENQSKDVLITNNIEKKLLFELKWSKRSHANSYLVTYSFNKKMTSPIEKHLSESDLKIPSESDKVIYWKISCANEDGKSIGSTSPIFRQTIKLPPLPTPYFRVSESESINIFSPKKLEIVLKWNKVKNKKRKVHFQISKDKDFKEVITSKKLEKNTSFNQSLNIDRNFKAKIFFYRAKTVSQNNESPWTKTIKRKVSFFQNVPEATNLSFRKAKKSKNGKIKVKLSWKSKYSNAKFKLILTKQGSKKSISKLTSKNKIVFGLSTDNLYSWSIQVIAKDIKKSSQKTNGPTIDLTSRSKKRINLYLGFAQHSLTQESSLFSPPAIDESSISPSIGISYIYSPVKGSLSKTNFNFSAELSQISFSPTQNSVLHKGLSIIAQHKLMSWKKKMTLSPLLGVQTNSNFYILKDSTYTLGSRQLIFISTGVQLKYLFSKKRTLSYDGILGVQTDFTSDLAMQHSFIYNAPLSPNRSYSIKFSKFSIELPLVDSNSSSQEIKINNSSTTFMASYNYHL